MSDKTPLNDVVFALTKAYLMYEDCKLVPLEPTDEMLEAGIKAFQHNYNSDDAKSDWRAFYKACIEEFQSVIEVKE